MTNCGCHMCRLAGISECDGKHPKSEIVTARHINGAYWWGRGKKKAKGRWVNVCVHCIDNLDPEDSEAGLKAQFGLA